MKMGQTHGRTDGQPEDIRSRSYLSLIILTQNNTSKSVIDVLKLCEYSTHVSR